MIYKKLTTKQNDVIINRILIRTIYKITRLRRIEDFTKLIILHFKELLVEYKKPKLNITLVILLR